MTAYVLFFQIGKWSADQGAVFYDSILHNIKQPDRGCFDGSFQKVVTALVRNTGQKIKKQIENNIWARGDVEFFLECSTRYLVRARRKSEISS